MLWHPQETKTFLKSYFDVCILVGHLKSFMEEGGEYINKNKIAAGSPSSSSFLSVDGELLESV